MWNSLGIERLKRGRSLVFLATYLLVSMFLGVAGQLAADIPDEVFLGGLGAIFPMVLGLLFTIICVSTRQINWTWRKRVGFVVLTWLGITIVGTVIAELLVPLLDHLSLTAWRGLIGNGLAGSLFITIAMAQSRAFAHETASNQESEVGKSASRLGGPYRFVLMLLAVSLVLGFVIRQVRIGEYRDGDLRAAMAVALDAERESISNDDIKNLVRFIGCTNRCHDSMALIMRGYHSSDISANQWVVDSGVVLAVLAEDCFRLETMATSFEDPGLRSRFVPLASNYRDILDATVGLRDAVRLRDVAMELLIVDELRRLSATGKALVSEVREDIAPFSETKFLSEFVMVNIDRRGFDLHGAAH